ncbi:histidine kinase [Brachybacterium sp. P6-10-X1]|uniref:histidine kinase n=1 Tax=Brachybacterium sp. P6-10-X1 TaxID=1903186 RepID=UPI0009718A09|nr:histidine kinase [Brachybacterium sp. P6-10-X1]APX33231.1 histidine kinase [Brachybacterium sp. P6-10-X1]
MDLNRYVDELHRQLDTAAAAGGEDARDLAARLTAPLDAAARLVLLESLTDAVGEISVELAPTSVDLRLRGGGPEFVVTPGPDSRNEPPASISAGVEHENRQPVSEGGATSRTTLRLPDHLKNQTEVAAARDGVSVNTWLVRAVAAALEQHSGAPAARSTPGQRVTGWVR